MPTSETLLLPGFAPISVICRPSSSAAPLAKTPASLTAAAKALAANVPAYSSRPSASSTKSDLLGHALRASLASALEARTGYSLRWSCSATPAGRSWWALGTPARRTAETGCGLSPLISTPRANRWESPDSHGRRDWELLPTPMNKPGGGSTLDGGSNSRKAMRRRWATSPSLLPTPTAVNYGSNQGGAAGRTGPLRPSLASQTRGVHGVNLLLAICEWLMGYPPGWLADASRHTEMPSSRRSPKRSDAP